MPAPFRPLPSAARLLALALALGAGACTGGPGAPSDAPTAAALPDTPPQPPVLAEERIGEELRVRQIAQDTWVVTHERPLPANSLLARADDGTLLLVDTPFTPSATDELLRWAVARLGGGSLQVVNTHFHLDALGGNAALAAGGVSARGLVTTGELLAARGEKRRQELVASLDEDDPTRAELAALELVPPGAQYMASRFTLPFGGEPYVLVYPGPGHSPDNLTVWLPDRGILFGGCMVKGGSSLGFLGDADLGSWPAAIRELQTLAPRVVVPGHGDRLDPGLLDHTLALLAAAGEPPPPAPGSSD